MSAAAARIQEIRAQHAEWREQFQAVKLPLTVDTFMVALMVSDLLDELTARDAALESAHKMLAKIDAVHADDRYLTVWLISQLHAGPYTGPKYELEMQVLRAALAALAAGREEPSHDT